MATDLLSSIIIDYIAEAFKADSILAFVYFDYNEKKVQSVRNIAANILKQIVAWRTIIPESLQYSLESWIKGSNPKDLKEYTEWILNCVDDMQVHLIVDALDECEDSRNRNQVLKFLSTLQVKVKTLVTSRQTLPDSFKAETIAIQAQDQDIELYVRNHLQDTRFVNHLKNEIVSRVILCAQGT